MPTYLSANFRGIENLVIEYNLTGFAMALPLFYTIAYELPKIIAAFLWDLFSDAQFLQYKFELSLAKFGLMTATETENKHTYVTRNPTSFSSSLVSSRDLFCSTIIRLIADSWGRQSSSESRFLEVAMCLVEYSNAKCLVASQRSKLK